MDEQRPTPVVEDIEGTRQRLETWFSQRVGSPVSIGELSIPEATGMSNVTLLFDIRYEDAGQTVEQSCVGRLQPQVDKPLFPSYDLTLQYHIMAALDQHTDVPVPSMLGLESDTAVLGVPFYIMRKTDGRIPTDMPPYNMDGWMMHDIGPAEREQLWFAGVDTMARFHQVDYQSLDLQHVLPTGHGSALQQQLTYWREFHDWGMEGTRHDICCDALAWLEANQPADEVTRLCWGDARISNLIFTPDCRNVAAVLDWEMATLGNPVQDLAWYYYIDRCFAEGLGLERLPGLPQRDATIARWHAITQLDTSSFDYYTVFAGMRFALILSRIMVTTGQAEEIQTNFACQELARTLKEVQSA